MLLACRDGTDRTHREAVDQSGHADGPGIHIERHHFAPEAAGFVGGEGEGHDGPIIARKAAVVASVESFRDATRFSSS